MGSTSMFLSFVVAEEPNRWANRFWGQYEAKKGKTNSSGAGCFQKHEHGKNKYLDKHHTKYEYCSATSTTYSPPWVLCIHGKMTSEEREAKQGKGGHVPCSHQGWQWDEMRVPLFPNG